ncbi:phage repressor protein CI [Buttiauxella ferragutiae]|uniref:phage repressor protein CI n=1 Tax=Buttiauxella ferragutiae TaxID=82989 RepID=UPI001F53A701|nr:phage repressor protein CI [Buttiauxella ferragutiae]UNK60807.1 helix-turn-helix domain-containing protein [Buttiauxella ferragutiae]
MKIRDYTFEAVAILDRVCEIYGFHQKIQLADHFQISASSLSNRYTRGTISYDFASICALETGASLQWILTGKGERFAGGRIPAGENNSIVEIQKFTLSEGKLSEDGVFGIDHSILRKEKSEVFCVRAENKIHFIERSEAISDGMRLVDVDGSISIRELAVLPAKQVHVTGGKVPFECSFDEIKVLGRVAGIYSEVN